MKMNFLEALNFGKCLRIISKRVSLCEKYPSTEVFPGPYFLVFGLNTKKHGPEKIPYLGIFYTVCPYVKTLFLTVNPQINYCSFEVLHSG